jgi:hypothetical protein
MNRPAYPHHIARLSASAERVSLGDSTTLSWQVIGVEANVASVHLTSENEDGLSMIENTPTVGSREVIFTSLGRFTFRLTVTFGDGVKLSRIVSVRVGADP